MLNGEYPAELPTAQTSRTTDWVNTVVEISDEDYESVAEVKEF